MDALHAFVQTGAAALALLRMKLPVNKRVGVIALIEPIRPDHRPVGADASLPGRLIESPAFGAKGILIVVVSFASLIATDLLHNPTAFPFFFYHSRFPAKCNGKCGEPSLKTGQQYQKALCNVPRYTLQRAFLTYREITSPAR